MPKQLNNTYASDYKYRELVIISRLAGGSENFKKSSYRKTPGNDVLGVY